MFEHYYIEVPGFYHPMLVKRGRDDAFRSGMNKCIGCGWEDIPTTAEGLTERLLLALRDWKYLHDHGIEEKMCYALAEEVVE